MMGQIWLSGFTFKIPGLVEKELINEITPWLNVKLVGQRREM